MCHKECRIPYCLAFESKEDEILIVLEDLDQSGYAGRRSSVTWDEIEASLKWLANFHATFLGKQPTGLWETGTYWHLETRPDELLALEDKSLRFKASAIDKKLKESPFQTFVHGDAKLANFCFSKDGTKVAAVDFQYVGGGCGMKDVAYFIGSCISESECERYESKLLDFYFHEFRKSISFNNQSIDIEALEQDWRELYPFAWADFHRFLKGWSPGHWKINSYH